MTEKLSDDELLVRLHGGDGAAFGVIYERYHRLLYALAYKYLKATDASQDAVQHVFLKFWEARAVLTVQVNLKSYLYTMLKNFVLNEIRNSMNAIEKNYEMAQAAECCDNELTERLEDAEMTEELYRAIDRLPEQKRQVCLHKLEGNISNREIAEKMHISVPTVKTHYAQAIRMLRMHLQKLSGLLLMFL